MDLKKSLLSSIENHGKSDIAGIYNLYPHVRRFSILRNLFILQTEGWVIIRKTRTQDECLVRAPNVRRSRKKLFTQQAISFAD